MVVTAFILVLVMVGVEPLTTAVPPEVVTGGLTRSTTFTAVPVSGSTILGSALGMGRMGGAGGSLGPPTVGINGSIRGPVASIGMGAAGSLLTGSTAGRAVVDARTAAYLPAFFGWPSFVSPAMRSSRCRSPFGRQGKWRQLQVLMLAEVRSVAA